MREENNTDGKSSTQIPPSHLQDFFVLNGFLKIIYSNCFAI